MKIECLTSATTIFWRAFNAADTTYLIGLQEGIISPGQSVDFNHPTQSTLKMEIKRTDIHGELILAPGTVFSNTDGIEVNDNYMSINMFVSAATLKKEYI
jgi:hypothetical protein